MREHRNLPSADRRRDARASKHHVTGYSLNNLGICFFHVLQFESLLNAF